MTDKHAKPDKNVFLSAPFPIDRWALWEDFLEKEVVNEGIRSRFLISSFLMAFTGVRISEARLMTCRQLKTLLERGSVRIFHVKRLKREGRIITLPAAHRKKLRELSSFFGDIIGTDIASEKDWPLFPGITLGNSISRQHFNEELNKLLVKFAPLVNPSDDYRLTSHSFRIGYITWAEAQGVPPDQNKRIVGHKSLDTTLRYSRFMTEGKQEEILTNVLPSHFKSSKGKISEPSSFLVNGLFAFFFIIFPLILSPLSIYYFYLKRSI